MDIALKLEIPDLMNRLEKRLTQLLVDEAWEWGQAPQALSRWEDENLLDHPTPELLEKHKATMADLLSVGGWLQQAMDHPSFPDRETLAMVQATMCTLQQMHDHFHKPRSLSEEEADRMLAKVFPDEP